MPRKTKKISTDKPADTKKSSKCDDCLAWVGLTVLGTCLVFAAVNWASATRIPEWGDCYTNQVEEDVIAIITNVGQDKGEYTNVHYDVVDGSYGHMGVEHIVRHSGDFTSLYKRLSSCDSFYRLKDRIEIFTLTKENHRLQSIVDQYEYIEQHRQ